MSTEAGLTKDGQYRADVQVRPWSREDGIALCALGVLLLAGLSLLVHPWFDPMNDASIYISSTRALLAGDGYSYLGMPFHMRPPGFSFLLAPLLAAGANYHALNLYVAAFGCGVLVLLFVWVRPRLGWLLGLLVCCVVGLNPVFLKLCNQVMSDVPGVFFLLATLLVARACERKPSLGREILLGLCIGLSAHVRVPCLLLLPAILLDRVVRHGWRLREPQWWNFAVRRCVPVMAVTVITFSPWVVRNQFTQVEPFANQLKNHSYLTGLLHTDSGDPRSPRLDAHDWVQRSIKRGGQIAAALATRLDESKPTLLRVGVATLVLGVYIYWLVVSPSVSGFFILWSLVVAVFYFAYQDRLLLPVFVLGVPALAEGLHRLIGERFGARPATAAVALVLIVISVSDFSPRQRWPEIRSEHERMTRIASALGRELPSDARLATALGFHYGTLLDRPVYSLRWASRLGAGFAGIDAVIDRYRINTVILDPELQSDRLLGPRLVKRYGDGRWIEGIRVIRVRD